MSTTTTASAASTASTTAVPIGVWARRTLRFALSLGIGVAVAWVVYRLLPDRLDVQTDIVGFPIHSNFFIQRYYYVYATVVVVGPLAVLAAYVVLGRLVAWFTAPSTRVVTVPIAPEPRPVEPWSVRTEIASWARVLLVGGVLGVEACTLVESRRIGVITSVTALYVAAVAVLGLVVARRRGGSHAAARSVVNAFGPVLAFMALWIVSEHTQVTVRATGVVHEYHWMPLWLAVIGGAALATAIALAVRRAPDDAGFARVERGVLLLLVGPLWIFMLMSRLPGDLNLYSDFEDGQLLAGAQFLLDGLFPWRDVILAHGVLQDGLVHLPGMVLFGETRWAAEAGTMLLVLPAAWIGTYYLAVYLFRRNWVFLVGIVALIAIRLGLVDGLFQLPPVRFILLPYLLLLFAALLRRPTWPWASAFTVLLVVQAILVPELVITIPIFAAVLAVFEFVERDRQLRLLAAFPRVGRCAVVGAASLVVFAVFLALNDSLDDFIGYFGTFVGSHLLVGGLNLLDDGSTAFTIAFYGPVVLVLLAIWFFVARLRANRGFGTAEWVMIADAALLLVYYTKFITRGDIGHASQVFVVAVPLVYYVVYRLIDAVEQLLRRTRTGARAAHFVGPHWVTAIILVALVVPHLGVLEDRGREVPIAFRPMVEHEPNDPRLGYALDGVGDGSGRPDSDLRRVIDAIEGRDGTVWDFSNSIATTSFLLHEPLVTQFDNVSIAVMAETQRDLIEQLREDPPGVIIYDSYVGLVSWDGVANPVRHYLVSSYILRNYRPFVSIGGYLLYVRNDLHPTPEEIEALGLQGTPHFDDLPFRAGTCDWGYAPHFFNQKPAGDRRVAVPTRPGGRVFVTEGWVPEQINGHIVDEVLAVHDGTVVGRADRNRPRLDLLGKVGNETPYGFGLGVESRGTRLYSLLDDGTAVQVDAPADWAIDNTPLPTDAFLDGDREVPIPLPAARRGAVERVTERDSTILDMPVDAADYDWFEVSSDRPLPSSTWSISDNGDPMRAIMFKTFHRRDDSSLVRVGSCPAWLGYEPGAPLRLTHDGKIPDLHVELRD